MSEMYVLCVQLFQVLRNYSVNININEHLSYVLLNYPVKINSGKTFLSFYRTIK